jgi:hypothetical protein
MTPEQALQLISEALEPKNIHAISRQGYIAIQQAIEVIEKTINPQKQSNTTRELLDSNQCK